MLVDKLKEIAKATQYPVTLNPNAIYLGSNNPLTKNNVLIQVEGLNLQFSLHDYKHLHT